MKCEKLYRRFYLMPQKYIYTPFSFEIFNNCKPKGFESYLWYHKDLMWYQIYKPNNPIWLAVNPLTLLNPTPSDTVTDFSAFLKPPYV